MGSQLEDTSIHLERRRYYHLTIRLIHSNPSREFSIKKKIKKNQWKKSKKSKEENITNLSHLMQRYLMSVVDSHHDPSTTEKAFFVNIKIESIHLRCARIFMSFGLDCTVRSYHRLQKTIKVRFWVTSEMST